MNLDVTEWLARCPLVAILRGVRPDEVEAIGEALVAAGIAIIEVPLNSPEPVESVRRLAARLGDRALVGAGTVRRETEVAAVAEAGGRLLVTPHADTGLVRAAKARGMVAMPGFLTPTEAFGLLDAGADALKLFPAEAGGPPMLKACGRCCRRTRRCCRSAASTPGACRLGARPAPAATAAARRCTSRAIRPSRSAPMRRRCSRRSERGDPAGLPQTGSPAEWPVSGGTFQLCAPVVATVRLHP